MLWHDTARGRLGWDGHHGADTVFVFLTALIGNIAQAADESARVILVLDASGSMRAKTDGKCKTDIAKAVVGRIVKSWNPEDELGLRANGQLEKGSCDDSTMETMFCLHPRFADGSFRSS